MKSKESDDWPRRLDQIEADFNGGRRMIEYMMQVERILYQRGSMGILLDTLMENLGERRGTKLSKRSVENIISCLREAYYAHFKIPPKESITTEVVKKISRNRLPTERYYRLNTGNSLLFPYLIFEKDSERTKINLMLKAGELFSLPFEAFLEKNHVLDADSKEIFKDVIDTGFRPFEARVFATIFDAITSKCVIEFQYNALTKAKDNPDSKTILTPYFLKSYNNKWYVLGHVRQRNQDWNVFALDRITDVKERKDLKPYEYDVNIIKEFYDKVIGFFVPPNPDGTFPENAAALKTIDINITLKDEKKAYFLSKNPIHSSQHPSKNNPLVFHLNCIENVHLYQALLRIISDIRWIEPQFIRENLIKQMEDASNLLKMKPNCI